MSGSRLLVIGAAGNIGTATIRASLARGIPTIAFLRNPSKLPLDLQHANLTGVQGDARSKESVKAAIKNNQNPASAVVLAAPMGSMRERGKTHYEEIARTVVESVQEVQEENGGGKIKLWIMAGSALLGHPEHPDRLLNSFMPMAFYEEYEYTWKDLKARFQDVDWSINCPSLIKSGEPAGPYYYSTEVLPGYRPPYSLTRYLPFGLGYFINIMFSNWVSQPVSFKTLGEFMVDHLEVGTELAHKRVGVLEDPKGSK